MPRPAASSVDPSASRRPPRRPGRPSRTSLDELVAAATDLGLDRFTLAGVAARVGVGESTVYNYVTGRDQLYSIAAAEAFAELDVEVDADGWSTYVDTIAERVVDLVRRHPGLREYVLQGPYEPSTIAIFEALDRRDPPLASGRERGRGVRGRVAPGGPVARLHRRPRARTGDAVDPAGAVAGHRRPARRGLGAGDRRRVVAHQARRARPEAAAAAQPGDGARAASTMRRISAATRSGSVNGT